MQGEFDVRNLYLRIAGEGVVVDEAVLVGEGHQARLLEPGFLIGEDAAEAQLPEARP